MKTVELIGEAAGNLRGLGSYASVCGLWDGEAVMSTGDLLMSVTGVANPMKRSALADSSMRSFTIGFAIV